MGRSRPSSTASRAPMSGSRSRSAKARTAKCAMCSARSACRSRLIRVSFGPFQLGELPRARSRKYDAAPARAARRETGEAAGADFSAPIAERDPDKGATRAAPDATCPEVRIPASDPGRRESGLRDPRNETVPIASIRGPPSRADEPVTKPPKRGPERKLPVPSEVRRSRSRAIARQDDQEDRRARADTPRREPREAKPAAAGDRRERQPCGRRAWSTRIKPGARRPVSDRRVFPNPTASRAAASGPITANERPAGVPATSKRAPRIPAQAALMRSRRAHARTRARPA